MLIRLSDSTGLVDLHFLRYLHLSLFPERPPSYSLVMLEDLAILVFIVTPLFVLGLRFWTAPAYLNYRWKANSFALPLCIVPVFFADHLDIRLLGGVMFFMNYQAFWQHAGTPPKNLY